MTKPSSRNSVPSPPATMQESSFSASASTSSRNFAIPSPATMASSSSAPMSKSDLALFVGAVLRDPVMVDLIAESEQKDEQIEQQQEDRLRIEITGRNGTLKFCQGSMKNGVSVTGPDNTPKWEVQFDQSDDFNTTIPNFIDTVEELEVRLGGVVQFQFDEAHVHSAYDLDPEGDNTGFDRRTRDTATVAAVYGGIGPVLYDQFVNIENQLTSLHEPERAPLLRSLDLKIEKVVFDKSKIRGILSLLESMAISTA